MHLALVAARHRSRRRGDHDADDLRRDGQRHHPRRRDARARRHPARRLLHRPCRDRARDHAAHEGDPADAPRRLGLPHGRDPGHRPRAQPARRSRTPPTASAPAIGGRSVGAFGDATVFSFYPTKNVTSGRGGMLTTDDDALAERCRLLALHGMSNDAWDRYTERGLVGLPRARGRLQLHDERLPGGARARAVQRASTSSSARAARSRSATTSVSPRCRRSSLPVEREGTTHAWHLYVVRLRP